MRFGAHNCRSSDLVPIITGLLIWHIATFRLHLIFNVTRSRYLTHLLLIMRVYGVISLNRERVILQLPIQFDLWVQKALSVWIGSTSSKAVDACLGVTTVLSLHKLKLWWPISNNSFTICNFLASKQNWAGLNLPLLHTFTEEKPCWAC